MHDKWGGGRYIWSKGTMCVWEYIEEGVCTLYMEEAQDFYSCAKRSVRFFGVCIWNQYVLCSIFLLSSTQSEVASRVANIRQLEERCEQLEAQVSLAICAFCDTYCTGWTLASVILMSLHHAAMWRQFPRPSFKLHHCHVACQCLP